MRLGEGGGVTGCDQRHFRAAGLRSRIFFRRFRLLDTLCAVQFYVYILCACVSPICLCIIFNFPNPPIPYSQSLFSFFSPFSPLFPSSPILLLPSLPFPHSPLPLLSTLPNSLASLPFPLSSPPLLSSHPSTSPPLLLPPLFLCPFPSTLLPLLCCLTREYHSVI